MSPAPWYKQRKVVLQGNPVRPLRLFPGPAMRGGSSGSNDPPRPVQRHWLWHTHDAIRAEGRSRHEGPEPPSGQTRWHAVAQGGYRPPNPPAPAPPDDAARRRSRSPAASVAETRVFDPESEDAETLNEMAERLKTAYFSLGRRLAKFDPQHHTLVVCGRTVQVLHVPFTCCYLLHFVSIHTIGGAVRPPFPACPPAKHARRSWSSSTRAWTSKASTPSTHTGGDLYRSSPRGVVRRTWNPACRRRTRSSIGFAQPGRSVMPW